MWLVYRKRRGKKKRKDGKLHTRNEVSFSCPVMWWSFGPPSLRHAARGSFWGGGGIFLATTYLDGWGFNNRILTETCIDGASCACACLAGRLADHLCWEMEIDFKTRSVSIFLVASIHFVCLVCLASCLVIILSTRNITDRGPDSSVVVVVVVIISNSHLHESTAPSFVPPPNQTPRNQSKPLVYAHQRPGNAQTLEEGKKAIKRCATGYSLAKAPSLSPLRLTHTYYCTYLLVVASPAVIFLPFYAGPSSLLWLSLSLPS